MCWINLLARSLPLDELSQLFEFDRSLLFDEVGSLLEEELNLCIVQLLGL